MKSAPSRLALLGLAIGVLLALLFAPQTRWLVRLQVLTSLRLYHPFPSSADQSFTRSQADDDRHVQAVISQQPGDFGLQYAGAVNNAGSAQAVAHLRTIESRFSDQPALYANLLRYASSDLHWNRNEENALYGLPVARRNGQSIPSSPQFLLAYDQDAAAGERLDPDNAYFPVMRAIGLFAAHRDAEGLAAMERAGRETEWREYAPEDVEARWHLHEAAFEDPSAFPRSVMAYSTPFPQYARLRALARLLLAKTVAQEQAGHAEEGLKRREEVRHYGDLMRVQSTSAISSLVGIAIAAIATSRPGGAPMPRNEPSLPREQMAQRRLDAYCAYITRIGHPEAAARARVEQEAGRQVTTLVNVDRIPDLVGPIFRLAAWWTAGLAALANSGWLLLFGGLAALLARGRRVQEASPLPSGAVGGITAALILGLAGIILGVMNPTDKLAENSGYYIAVFVLLPGALALIASVLRPHLRRSLAIGTLACLLALAILGILGTLIVCQAHSLNDLLTALEMLNNSTDDNDETRQVSERLQLVVSAALVVAVTLLLLLILSIASRRRRVPVSVGLVQGFRAWALPLVCLLLLLWGGLLLGTVRQERLVNAGLWHTVHDEGRYLAAQAGQPWPGPVR